MEEKDIIQLPENAFRVRFGLRFLPEIAFWVRFGKRFCARLRSGFVFLN